MDLRTIREWLAFRDYDRAKADGVRKIMGRFSRGNVNVQAGRYISDSDMLPLVERGDRAMAELDRAAG